MSLYSNEIKNYLPIKIETSFNLSSIQKTGRKEEIMSDSAQQILDGPTELYSRIE